MASVAVAVNGGQNVSGKGSQLAVEWAVKKLLPKARRFVLVHVLPTISSISSPNGGRIPADMLDENDFALFADDQRSKCKEELLRRYSKFIKPKDSLSMLEIVVLFDNDAASALLAFASHEKINDLVLGSCSYSIFDRKTKELSIPKKLLKSSKLTCNVHVVGKENVSKREANGDNFSGISRDGACSGASTEHEISDHDSEDSRTGFSSSSSNSAAASSSTAYSAAAEEMATLRREYQTILSMYNNKCEELAHTLNKVRMLSSECHERSTIVNAAIEREEKLRRIAAEESDRFMKAKKEADQAKILLAKESTERNIAEMNNARVSKQIKKMSEMLLISDTRYRRYTMDDLRSATDNFSEKNIIGEGSYGKVYKCIIDSTPVAVKVLQTDAVLKKVEFLKEIEILSFMRHPNLVLLVGACPESRCLVYEYMENGSLDEHIFRKNGKLPLPWRIRFRIIFEIACGLAFLHNSNPPIVHRDLKPGNILLDGNFVSKIGDVGLSKFIYNQVPENVTEYRDSILAGSFHYMDPEYHRTGTIRPKSDLYAFGIIILQMLSGRSPNHLSMIVEKAINSATLAQILDPYVSDWPLLECIKLAQIGLQCSNIRCRDRPDLEEEVLPVLKKIADTAEEKTEVEKSFHPPSTFVCPLLRVVMEEPCIAADGFSYEGRAIAAWLRKHNVSPVTKMELKHTDITPNFTLRSAIQVWKSHVNYSNSDKLS